MIKWPWNKDTEPVDTVISVINSGGDIGKLDEYSPTWLYIKKWAEEEIEFARRRNDSITNTEIKTAVIRGEIKELKKLISLPNTILSREYRLEKPNRPNQAGDEDE